MDATQQALRNTLIQGLTDLQLNNEDPVCDALFEYSKLLQKWNRSYNLTAIDDPEKIIIDHFLDSLSIWAFLHGSTCLDVGTGAGFPGLVLALANPGRLWVLLDSNIKKTRFLTQACMALGINNVEVVHARVDEYRPDTGFDTITSRAFASVIDFYQQSSHLLNNHGRLLAMKGANVQEELKTLEQNKIKYEIRPLLVPGMNKDRYLIEIIK